MHTKRFIVSVFSVAYLIISVFSISTADAQDTWAFEPGDDPFAEASVFDLRTLNEEVAGQNGYIRKSKDGNDFVRGDGQSMKWVAMNGAWGKFSDKELAEHARFLAKHGINVVRWHGDMVPYAGGSQYSKDYKVLPGDQYNKRSLDTVHRLVAAMKKEGIYTIVSPYWHHRHKVPASWGVEGEDQQRMVALLFYHPKFQEYYKGWLDVLFNTQNPYTGVAIKDEPAVSLIQLQNEDSLLHWTFQQIQSSKNNPEQWAIISRQFGDWLKGKYGSLDKAVQSWGEGATLEDDDFEKGLVSHYIIWEMTQDQTGGKARRMADQLQFYTETMFNFNAAMEKYLREELGCKHLVNAANWKTADPLRLNDAERYAYTANDVIAKNNYFAELAGKDLWMINKGQYYKSISAMMEPSGFINNVKLVEGYPAVLTETQYFPPNDFEAEAPFMTSAYSSLTGLDGYTWFSTDDPQWSQPQSSHPKFKRGMARFSPISGPMSMGQYPATMLMLRRGYVAKAGQPAVHEYRTLEDIYNRVPPVISEGTRFDPNEYTDNIAAAADQTEVSPLAFFVGPVKVTYGADESRVEKVDLDKYILEDGMKVRSLTGQLEVDFAKQFTTLDAPKAQGASGRLADAGSIALSTVALDVDNPIATVLAVSLDGEDLKASKQILVQVGTKARPTAWKEEATTFKKNKSEEQVEGFQILDVGRAPWQIEKALVRMTITNPGLSKVTALDANGYRKEAVEVKKENGTLQFVFPADRLYVVVE